MFWTILWTLRRPFADPSLTLRISSGLRLRASAQDSVWPSFFVILLFLSFWPWAKRRGRISSQSCHSEPPFLVILRHEVPKNLLSSSFFSLKPAIRDSSGDLPPRNDKKESFWASAKNLLLFFYNRNEFLRFAQDDASGDLPPRNDKKRSHPFASLRTALWGRAPQKVIDFLGTPH